ncbi:MAG: 3-isopropylmalate dehydrogenase [Eubacterium sp.]|nr:3-isopropylmalate dehydrogenase [Eubacterium sp.]
MQYRIALLKGDGIGPEVINETIKVLDAVGKKYGHQFLYTDALIGGAALDQTGESLPDETVKICKTSEAVLLGAVGGPKWNDLPKEKSPALGLLDLRKALDLCAGLRPAIVFTHLADASPMKASIISEGLDIVVVREMAGGIYAGESGYNEQDPKAGMTAFDTEQYSETEIRRVAKIAFDMAMKREHRVTSVDKASVLETSRLWRRVVSKTAEDYPEVTLEHMPVDTAAMQLVRNPRQFDVILTSNMFGDILADEAGQLTGLTGILPYAYLGKDSFGLYAPLHGSAPDLAGTGQANPIATILASAMMLRYTFGLPEEADAIEGAVNHFLDAGYRLPNLLKVAGTTEGLNLVTTAQAGDLIASFI